VRRVLAHLSRGYAYSEAPPRRTVPLEAFLFEDRAGYCEQFSGAMALLLRMAGVPARVVGGFAPGSYDARRSEWVVRDLDAHSWVEAYFPGYGWATFDPTPAAAPARSQIGVDTRAVAPGGVAGARLGPGDRPEPGPRAGANPGEARAAAWRWLLVAALVAAVTLAAAFWTRVRRRRQSARDPALAELERALRRAGQPAAPCTTLRSLERRFAGDPGAAYLAALRAVRFGYGDPRPTPEQRRALRRALARGRGLPGRLRALWALPPRPRPASSPRARGRPGRASPAAP
jgi:hypothetical protein